jgi:SNF2 family DNA or RNA helicase
VFTQFAEWGDRLQAHLRDRLGREVLSCTAVCARPSATTWWPRSRTRAGPSVFVLSLKAGGVGLNLTAANHVIHYDRWWNPAVENQATDRAFRIGQRRDVVVRRLVCAGTLEERIAQLIEEEGPGRTGRRHR